MKDATTSTAAKRTQVRTQVSRTGLLFLGCDTKRFCKELFLFFFFLLAIRT